jgi:glycosyltransferase involved in cell wall biosynthesis
VRILMVTHQLPAPAQPNTMAPVARQIDSLRAIGVQVDVLEIKGIPKLKYLQALPSLWALARSVDLIHAHYGYCGWLARLQFSKPMVVSFMGDDLLGTPDAKGHLEPLSRLVVQVDRWLARVVDAVIVKSAEMARVVEPVQAHVLPNGVDLQLFRPMDLHEARALLGWPEGKRYILFPGRPDIPRKGFPLAQAVVIHASKQICEPLALVPLERVAPNQVPLYMNACDAMVMTSFIEGSPNAVKEAMACNLPIVSVPVGDVPELLDGLEGHAICPRDAEALAEAMVSMLANRQRVDGRAVLKRKGLDLEGVARQLVRIYTDVLTQQKS